MATIEDVALGAIAAIRSDASVVLASQWANQRYKELAAKVRMNHLREVGMLEIPANVTAGTVGVNRDSKIVSGNAAAQAAWSNAVVGRWFRAENVWYRIDAFSGTALTLNTPYAEDTATAASYHIVARHLFVDPRARHLSEWMVFPRRRRFIWRQDLTTFNIETPDRILRSGGPFVWSEIGVGNNADNQKARMVEVYPYADDSEVLYYLFWREADDLNMNDDLPYGIDEYVLREGVLIDVMRYEMSGAMKAGTFEQAAIWRNEYRAQETRWEKFKRDAVRQERGTDDRTFILKTLGMSFHDFEITNAHQHVLANWPR